MDGEEEGRLRGCGERGGVVVSLLSSSSCSISYPHFIFIVVVSRMLLSSALKASLGFQSANEL